MKHLFVIILVLLSSAVKAQTPKEEVKPCIVIYCDTSNQYFGHDYDPKLLDTLIETIGQYAPAFESYSLHWENGFYAVGDKMEYFDRNMRKVPSYFRVLRILKPKE